MILPIDLETIPVQDEEAIEYLLANLSPPGNYKKQEAIDKWMVESKEKAILDTSFDGTYGEICTVGFTTNDAPIKAYQRTDTVTEKAILQQFFDYLAFLADKEHKTPKHLNLKWIAHNKDFDIRFLWQRCVINNIDTYGIKIPVNDRHDTQHVYCTLQAWRGFGAKAGGSLDSICRALGIEGKQGMTGADVWPEFQKGNYKKIAEYCEHDVDVLRQIYYRMNFITRSALEQVA